MGKHRAVIVGAGRIGAGYNWHDDGYTHAGAYKALKDRVELLGFVEPNQERAEAAEKKWGLPVHQDLTHGLYHFKPDIVSVCVQPENQGEVMERLPMLKGIWCEKPWVLGDINPRCPTQVNYQRRGDEFHRRISKGGVLEEGLHRLVVYGKDNETTRCHFRDLARWWNVPLDYRVHDGPCAYILEGCHDQDIWFDGGNGGVDSAQAFKNMLGNLLDAVEGKAELWSPPYAEAK